MNTVSVNLLGIGAVKISDGEKIIYIDAFSEFVKSKPVERADLILLTHDDGDHFGVKETAFHEKSYWRM